MKVIDLLNKIANNEKLPRKIKYKSDIWEYDVVLDMYLKHWTNDKGEALWRRLDTQYYINECLNDTVEILEEKEIPEKLNLDKDELRGKETPRAIDYLIEDKINEVIDYLKSKGDE